MNKLLYNKVFLCALLFSLSAPYSVANEKAGKVMIASGKVAATSSDNKDVRRLKRRSLIFTNDTVTTGPASKTQMRMVDGSMVALKENTELIITQYKFNKEDEKKSAVLNLVTGGLRSITGAIKADKKSYQLKTPVGSIGIRGTHYQVEVLNDVVWLAVWDGAIDVVLGVGAQAGSILSLGSAEKYSYSSIDINGMITQFIESPKIFKQGMSSLPKEKSTFSDRNNITTSIQENKLTNLKNDTGLILTSIEKNFSDFINNDELNSLAPKSVIELVEAKQGSIKYSDAVVSSSFNLSNFSAGMSIDFDSGRISNGQLSFNDDRSTEKWNAVFNGNMNVQDGDVFLETGITFASHGDKLADGDISAGFIDLFGLGAVSGSFELHEESENENISVDGAYLIGTQP